MMRIDYRTLALAASASMLAAVVILPQTRWIVLNHLDFLTGGWGKEQGYLTPVRLLDPRQMASRSVEAKLAHAAYDGGLNAINLRAYIELADNYPENVLLQASAVSRARLLEMGVDVRKKKGLHAGLLRVADRGERLEPNNMFFPFCSAILNFSANNDKVADAALERAAKCTFFDDHALEEVDAKVKAFEDHQGYRGKRVRFSVTNAQPFEYSSLIMHVTKEVPSHGSAVEERLRRARLFQCAAVMHRTSKTTLLKALSRSMGFGQLAREPLRPSKSQEVIEMALRNVPEMRRVQVESGIPGPADPGAFIVEARNLKLGSRYDSDPATTEAVRGVKTARDGPTVLAAIIALPFIATLSLGYRLAARWHWVKALIPYAAALAALWSMLLVARGLGQVSVLSDHNRLWISDQLASLEIAFVPGCIALITLALISAFPRMTAVVYAVTIALCVLAVPLLTLCPLAGVAPLAFLLAYLSMRAREVDKAPWLGVAGLLAGSAAPGFLLATLALTSNGEITRPIVAAALPFVVIAPLLVHRQLRAGLTGAFSILSLAYLWSISLELQDDKLLGAVLDSWSF